MLNFLKLRGRLKSVHQYSVVVFICIMVIQELFRKFVSILNKLTPQKFETLANQALQLVIDTEEHMKGCTDRIFIAVCIRECAVYVYMYALME